jgi:uncharacterized repeat protein (TIGR01451 family)
MTSLEPLSYIVVSNLKPFTVQYEEAMADIQAQNGDVIAHTVTARNLGQINITIFFYVPSTPGNLRYSMNHFTSTGSY